MDIQKILDSIPDSAVENIADKVGVDAGTVQHVLEVTKQEIGSGGELWEAGRELIDKDGDGEILDDLSDFAKSMMNNK